MRDTARALAAAVLPPHAPAARSLQSELATVGSQLCAVLESYAALLRTFEAAAAAQPRRSVAAASPRSAPPLAPLLPRGSPPRAGASRPWVGVGSPPPPPRAAFGSSPPRLHLDGDSPPAGQAGPPATPPSRRSAFPAAGGVGPSFTLQREASGGGDESAGYLRLKPLEPLVRTPSGAGTGGGEWVNSPSLGYSFEALRLSPFRHSGEDAALFSPLAAPPEVAPPVARPAPSAIAARRALLRGASGLGPPGSGP